MQLAGGLFVNGRIVHHSSCALRDRPWRRAAVNLSANKPRSTGSESTDGSRARASHVRQYIPGNFIRRRRRSQYDAPIPFGERQKPTGRCRKASPWTGNRR